eukprot:s724_g26.t1
MAFLTAAASAGCSAARTASICVSDLQLRTVRTGTPTDRRNRHKWRNRAAVTQLLSWGQVLATAPTSMDVACQPGYGAARHPPNRCRWKSAGRAGPAQVVNIAMGERAMDLAVENPLTTRRIDAGWRFRVQRLV